MIPLRCERLFAGGVMRPLFLLLLIFPLTCFSQDPEFPVDNLVEDVGSVINCNHCGKDGTPCRYTLGWGHTTESKKYQKTHKDENVIVEGCNVGKSGNKELKDIAICQKGPNGNWFGLKFQTTANGGKNLFDLSDLAWQSQVSSKNNTLGFMRMTQAHFIGILLKAQKAIKKRQCKKAIFKFVCTSGLSSL